MTNKNQPRTPDVDRVDAAEQLAELVRMTCMECQDKAALNQFTFAVVQASREALTKQYRDARDADDVILGELDMDAKDAGKRFNVPDWQ